VKGGKEVRHVEPPSTPRACGLAVQVATRTRIAVGSTGMHLPRPQHVIPTGPSICVSRGGTPGGTCRAWQAGTRGAPLARIGRRAAQLLPSAVASASLVLPGAPDVTQAVGPPLLRLRNPPLPGEPVRLARQQAGGRVGPASSVRWGRRVLGCRGKMSVIRGWCGETRLVGPPVQKKHGGEGIGIRIRVV
jgi:hypothetical protein